MAFDFPNSPTTGQIVTGPNGIQYQWDGVKWATAPTGIGGPFLPLVGGTLTGPGNLSVAGTLGVTGVSTFNNDINAKTYVWYGANENWNSYCDTGIPIYDSLYLAWRSNIAIRFGVTNVARSVNLVANTDLNVGGVITSDNSNRGNLPGNKIRGMWNGQGLWDLCLGNGATANNLEIDSYDNGGNLLGSVLTINRLTGVAAFNYIPTHPTPPAGDNSTNSATTAFVAPTVQAAGDNTGRNYIHNPTFRIAQRGAGPFTASTYCLDRWGTGVVNDTDSWTQGQLTDTNRTQIGDESALYCIANTFTGNAAATSQSRIWQGIEDVHRLANKTVTVSFWAAAGVAGVKLGVNFGQYFGAGGSPSATAEINGQAVTLTTAFTRYNLTFNIPSVAGKTVGTNSGDHTYLQFWYSAGSNFAATSGGVGVQSGSVLIWGVQVEVGNIATPLAKRDPADELALCQRFYFAQSGLSIGGGGTTSTMTTIFGFPVTMRAPPTMTYNAISTGGSWASPAVGTVTNSLWIFNVTPSGTNAYYGNLSFTASADL